MKSPGQHNNYIYIMLNKKLNFDNMFIGHILSLYILRNILNSHNNTTLKANTVIP